MKYNFDETPDRLNTNSLKWDLEQECLPMWVADMDFQTSPEIIDAIKDRASHGIFGYSLVPDEWYTSIIKWWETRHNLSIKKEWLIFCTGIVPAITCSVKRLTNHGDNVLVQTPVYGIFFSSIENTGRHVLENRLKFNGREYEIDFEDLEKKLAHPLTTLMILCNPQNPSGKIWSKDELMRIGELCEKYHVTVIADEIHCDLTNPDLSYTPFASVSEICRNNSITCVSASKAFNIAGLQSAAVFIPNEKLRQNIYRGLNSDELAEPNCFAAIATATAFMKGGEWLDSLREYLYENKLRAYELIKNELPEVTVVEAPATYLLWIDCRKITEDTSDLCDYLKKTQKLFLSDGSEYRGDGKLFVRMNVACPRNRMEEGIRRFCEGCKAYME